MNPNFPVDTELVTKTMQTVSQFTYKEHGMASTRELASQLSAKYRIRIGHWNVRRVLDYLEESQGVKVPRFGMNRIIDDELAERVEAELRRRKWVG